MSLAQDPEWFSSEFRESREGKHSNSERVTWSGGLLQEGAQPEAGEGDGRDETQGKTGHRTENRKKTLNKETAKVNILDTKYEDSGFLISRM